MVRPPSSLHLIIGFMLTLNIQRFTRLSRDTPRLIIEEKVRFGGSPGTVHNSTPLPVPMRHFTPAGCRHNPARREGYILLDTQGKIAYASTYEKGVLIHKWRPCNSHSIGDGFGMSLLVVAQETLIRQGDGSRFFSSQLNWSLFQHWALLWSVLEVMKKLALKSLSFLRVIEMEAGKWQQTT
jgi:hypothetical protein